MLTKEIITEALQSLQDRICKGLEQLDGLATFKEDLWQRPGGGGGRTRLIQQGNILEKGGVNFSAVHGQMPAKMLRQILKMEPQGEEALEFYATGVSIVLHPKNPMTPISHMNVRYFEMSNGVWWFGGGIDLTPHYVIPELAAQFHEQMHSVCHQFHPDYYDRFKEWCDDYFYIPHRKEMRGVGGIFFDRLGAAEPLDKETLFNFIIAVGDRFVPAYVQQAEATTHLPFGAREKAWQALRRGRYVEFNLVWDRGTKFGLETNGRTESILMSMPPSANWEYCFEAEVGSEEEKTLSCLKKGINWLSSKRSSQ